MSWASRALHAQPLFGARLEIGTEDQGLFGSDRERLGFSRVANGNVLPGVWGVGADRCLGKFGVLP